MRIVKYKKVSVEKEISCENPTKEDDRNSSDDEMRETEDIWKDTEDILTRVEALIAVIQKNRVSKNALERKQPAPLEVKQVLQMVKKDAKPKLAIQHNNNDEQRSNNFRVPIRLKKSCTAKHPELIKVHFAACSDGWFKNKQKN